MWKRIGLSIAVLALAAGAEAFPNAVPYQGRLLDAEGDPVADPVDVVVRVFAAGEPANLLYAEEHLGVEPTDGIFQIAIGTGGSPQGAFDASLFDPTEPPPELELEIDGEVLAPRQPFQATAYAFVCQDAGSLGGTSIAQFVLEDEPDVITNAMIGDDELDPAKIVGTAAVLGSNGVQSFAGGTFVIDGPQGDVETGGDYRYGSPRTFSHYVSPDRFIAESPDSNAWRMGSQNGMYRYSATIGSVRSYAGLNLPADARPQRLRCYYYDNSFFETVDFLTAQLQYRIPDTPATYASFGVLSVDSSFPAQSDIVRLASLALPDAPVPGGSHLLIDLQWGTSAETSALRFYGCEVEYEVDRVSLP